MASGIQYDIIATCSIAAGGAIVRARGCTEVKAAGLGAYDITLDGSGINAADCVCTVTPRTGADIAASVVHTSDTVKRVNMNTIPAAALADCAFDFVIARISSGAIR